MRNDLLYIDGELVDLDEDTKITLNIKSNLFTDLSKIVSNNSYTIKLPRTVRNQRIIEHADLPSSGKDYPRRYHRGRYFRNGVEIVPDARVALLSVSESIEMAMTWGNSVALATMIDGDKKLTDLPHIKEGGPYAGTDYREWKNWGSNDSSVYPKINYGFNEEETSVWYHPVEYVTRILERISNAHGISFVFPEDKLTFLNKLFVPLLTRNDSDIYSKQCTIDFIVKGIEYDEWVNQYTMYFDDTQISNFYGRTYSVRSNNMNAYYSRISNGKPILAGELTVYIQADKTPSSVVLNVHKANFDGAGANIETDSILEIQPVNIEVVEGYTNLFKVLFSFDDEQTNVLNNRFEEMKGAYMKFSFANIDGMNVQSAEGTITVKNVADEILMIKDGTNDGRFWIVPNLPDIKQVDFIKAIASILGVFAVADSSKQITFVSIDTLTENRGKAVDWTKKVVASYKENRPYNISYVLDGFVQKNNYRWKEDDSVNGNYDHYLMIEDETLEYEDDVVTLPFAATDMYNGIAQIPLYSYNANGEIQYKEVEPRLLLIDGTNGTFRGLDWATLISKYYQSYQGTIKKPVIIKEKIEIGDIGLRDIDVTVPVYLAQYGRYYAIISVKAENTGICECELLQLEV